MVIMMMMMMIMTMIDEDNDDPSNRSDEPEKQTVAVLFHYYNQTHCPMHYLLKRFFDRQTVCTILWKRAHVDWASLLCRFVANRTHCVALLLAMGGGHSLPRVFARLSLLELLLDVFWGDVGDPGDTVNVSRRGPELFRTVSNLTVRFRSFVRFRSSYQPNV